MAETIQVAGRTIEITHPDRMLYPEEGITKRDVIDYYLRVAPAMLPHLAGRPVSVERYPQGVTGQRFFQKRIPEHYPGWIGRVTVPLSDGSSQSQVLCDDAATLAYLANQGVVTIHTWLSQRGRLKHPDRLTLDLDPEGHSFDAVRQAAR